MPEPIDVNGENWQTSVMDSELPVLVDFWAEWCGPCKMIAPAIHDLALEYEGKLNVAKLDVDNASDIATRLPHQQHPGPHLFQERRGSAPRHRRQAQAGPEARHRIRPRQLAPAPRLRPPCGSGWGPVALADFKSVMPRDERG